MAQIWIREYDVKKMYFDFIWEKYTWKQVKIGEKLTDGFSSLSVVKPDMLFGGRWKLGLLWIWLTNKQVENWIKEKTKKQITVWKVSWDLTHFLVEDFVEHKKEYYISFSATRDYDLVNFSFSGWVEIEENWGSVIEIKISTLDDLSEEVILSKILNSQLTSPEDIEIKGNIIKTILNLWKFYKSYWFVYLEINPFCFDITNWKIVLLDMVAKIDNTELFRQKQNWWKLEFPSPFWFKESYEERYIKELDNQTGASLKFTVLNKNAKIWTLLAGWGWSLVITDSLGYLWYTDNIWNYWELSWNPTREFTREYTSKLLEVMLSSPQPSPEGEGAIKWKYLIIAWAIANFTDIKNTFSWMIDVFEEKIEEIKKAEIKILVRRWWINEKEWLKIMKENCERLWISCYIADSWEYMTDILKNIKI